MAPHHPKHVVKTLDASNRWFFLRLRSVNDHLQHHAVLGKEPQIITPPRLDMEPENDGFPKGFCSTRGQSIQVSFLVFWECSIFFPKETWTLKSQVHLKSTHQKFTNPTNPNQPNPTPTNRLSSPCTQTNPTNARGSIH